MSSATPSEFRPTVASRMEGAVRVLTLDRREKKNAFTAAMYDAFISALKEADVDPSVRIILVEGAGDAFTAGNDLADFLAQTQRAGSVEENGAIRLLLQLVDQQKPLVAAVDGPAVGIGTTMLLHFDYVVASDRAKFLLPFVNLGLSAEGGSTELLPQLVGLQRASEWLMFGEPFDSETARAGGLVNLVVPQGQLTQTALARAQVLAQKPREALLATKRVIREPIRARIRETILREGRTFFERLRSDEAKAAFEAFLSKKK